MAEGINDLTDTATLRFLDERVLTDVFVFPKAIE